MKNITLSMPEDLIKLGREYAAKHGTTLNEMIRELLRKRVINETDHPIERLIEHAEKLKIKKSSWKWNREEVYDRKIFS